jgi:hypothetical protein
MAASASIFLTLSMFAVVLSFVWSVLELVLEDVQSEQMQVECCTVAGCVVEKKRWRGGVGCLYSGRERLQEANLLQVALEISRD